MELLARIAVLYAETLGDHDQVDKISRAFGYSIDHVPNLIREARRAGLLTPTVRGKAGGAPTWKAYHYSKGQEPPELDELVAEKLGMPLAQAKSVLREMRGADMDLDEVARGFEAMPARNAERDRAARVASLVTRRRIEQLQHQLDAGLITPEEWLRRNQEVIQEMFEKGN